MSVLTKSVWGGLKFCKQRLKYSLHKLFSLHILKCLKRINIYKGYMSQVKGFIRNKGSRDIENHCGYLIRLVFAKFLDLAKTKGSNLSPSLSPD